MALKTITVRELITLLEDQDPDAKVIFSVDYGDYGHTQQALPLRGRVEEVEVEESAYSQSGYALRAEREEYEEGEEDPDDSYEPFLLIR